MIIVEKDWYDQMKKAGCDVEKIKPCTYCDKCSECAKLPMKIGEWRPCKADTMPKDGTVFLSLWKGRACLTQYDEDEARFYIIWEPAEYPAPWPVSKDRENKFTHMMFINEDL